MPLTQIKSFKADEIELEIKESENYENFRKSSKPISGEKFKVQLGQVPGFMRRLIKMMDASSIQVLSRMKKLIHTDSPPDVVQEMTEWKDEYNLNLVHYAILYKRKEVIHYLLSESGVFPEHSQPYTWPYAHLAAYLGHSFIVKYILTHRPGDFFTYDQIVSMPPYIIQRFDIKTGMSKAREKYKDILGAIHQFFSKNMETSSRTSVLADDTIDLNDRLKELHRKAAKEVRPSHLPSIKPEQQQVRGHVRVRKPTTYKRLFEDEYQFDNFKGKNPLTIAAEKGDTDTLKVILEVVFSKTKADDGPLLMAAKAASPEALTVVGQSMKIQHEDYTAAMLESMRQLNPDCLIAVLSSCPTMGKRDVLESGNLYHILYTQTIDVYKSKYAMVPMMTKALIHCDVNVNDYSKPQTFPLYSIITSLFHMRNTTQVYYTLECLKCLLAAGADPFFDENRQIAPRIGKVVPINTSVLYRDMYTSAFHCILENAKKSCTRGSTTATPLTNIIVRYSILFVLLYKKKRQRLNSFHLAMYLEKAIYIDLDEHLIKKMLESGIDPSIIAYDDKYPINFYFQGLFSFFRTYQMVENYEFYKKELGILIVVCRAMQPISLRIAVRILLNQYIRNIPLQAVPITQYFLYLADNLIKERKALGENFDLASERQYRD